MSTIAEPREETNRGADSGSPDVVSRSAKRAVDPPRIGPLPEPSLVERLRRSWSVEALLPAVDHEGGRSWKRAAWAAVALHLVVFAGIFAVSRLARHSDEGGFEVIGILSPPIEEKTQPDENTPETSGGAKDGDHSAGGESGGRGSNEDSTPVTKGPPPPTSPAPPPPAPVSPPLPSPISIPQTVTGPSVVTPPPTVPGIPTAPPGPAPSLGDQGDTGVGDHEGSSWGTSATDGPGGDKSGHGGRDDNPTGPAMRPGDTGIGTDLGKPGGLPEPTRDHGIKIIARSKPVITQAMVEAGTFGTVRVNVTIGADGRILSAEPMDRLANGGTKAAMDALYRCRFEPAVRDGKYVTSSTVIRFDITERGI